ncbi:60 kDa neurofilament protein-like [Octopus sinensis]|uniref:60 kDa neurofilament protein-like n=1 Tax=Octopus sinensis TaxID=2607531 RepID=A0A6P7TZR0_9MOLL|nr:60 kDa neurofilament protein-like [Octopus sinensis]
MSRNLRFGDSFKFRRDFKDENNINSENTTTYLKQTVEISNPPTSLAFGTPELDMFKDSRMREKSEMTNLNSRLANYIEISREKSNLNFELMDELEYVKNQIRNETGAIKELYEAELGQLRNVLDDMEHDKNEFILVADNNQRMCDDLEERINNFKNSEENNILKIKELDNQLSNLDFKINNLSSKNDFLKDEKNRDSEIIKNLRLDLEIAQNVWELLILQELNEETILRSDSQNRCQSIAEEIQFNTDIHERVLISRNIKKELKDLLAMANYDPLNQSKEWLNCEFSSCIKEIQEEYNNRLDEVKSEMESQYNTKNSMLISQNEKLRNEIKLLKDQYDYLSMQKMNEIDEIRKHQAAALAELRTIIDDNLSLQMEIVSYQKLLEYEEAR